MGNPVYLNQQQDAPAVYIAGGGPGGTGIPLSIGAANFIPFQVNNIGTAATTVANGRANRVSLTIYNTGTTTVFYGRLGVTTANGTRLLPGGSRTIYSTSAIAAVVASGTGSLDCDETY